MPVVKSTYGDRDGFDPVWYLRVYDDVRKAGIDPWHHYSSTGKKEGRQGTPLRALDLDHMLWRGFEDVALPALQKLVVSGNPREAAVAGWALARWVLDQGDIETARDMIMVFYRQARKDHAIRHPGPYLLAIPVHLACQDYAKARAVLGTLRRVHDSCADFDLAALLCDKAQGRDDAALNCHLEQIYARYDLPPVLLRSGEGTRFDRLTTDDVDPVRTPMPLVSIIMPVFNGADVLGHAIESLQRQSWTALEILVVDDGSQDDSVAVARRYGVDDPRIRILEQPENAGAYVARNAGLATAKGAFFTVHDADDWSHPDKIKVQVQALIEDETLSATVTHMVRASEDLDMTRWRMEDGWTYRNVSSLMMRISLRDRLGYWDRSRVSADTELYYRIQAADGPHAIHEVLSGVPMSFARTTAQSLTMQSKTHLRSQFNGVRRDYINAAKYWHSKAGSEADLYIPQFPEQRVFRIPASIAMGDSEPPQTPIDRLRASPLFDSVWYQAGNVDVLYADVDPERHYFEGGARENRDPGPKFSTGGYKFAHGLSDDENPLLHWIEQGQGGDPLPTFTGALTGKVSVVMFAHAAGKTLFGAERSLLDVVARIAARGLAPVVVLPTVLDASYIEHLLPITAAVEVLPQIWRYGTRAPHPDAVTGAQRLIEKYNPDEVHVNTLVLDAPLIAARAVGCPSVVHVRELPAQDVGLCRGLGTEPEPLRQILLEQADSFIANSPIVAQWLGCPDRTVVRPNSVHPDLFDLAFSSDGGALKVALISSNVVKKGILDVLQVAQRANEMGSKMRFLFIGPATQDLHMLRPWPDNIEFRGYADTPQEAIAQADIVLSLSRFAESFGRTVLEAMAAGRPVVCYDRGAPPSIVQSGKTGFVVPADCPELVLDALLALEAAPGQLAKFSAAARARARQLQDLAQSA